jgi:hypothetical protein
VPAEWASAQVKQGKETTKLAVQKDDRGAYVQYRVRPNAGVVRIDQAQ